MGKLGGKVAIIGTGTIKFGENFHQSLSDMIVEAVNLAMADARIESRQLQAAWETHRLRLPRLVRETLLGSACRDIATRDTPN